MKKLFWKAYIIYVIVFFIIIAISAGVMYHKMIKFEENTPENFIRNTLTNRMNEASANQLFVSNKFFENPSDSAQNIVDFFKTGEYDIKRIDKNVYDVVLDNRTLLRMYLDSIKTINVLGLLNYDELKVSKIVPNENKELFHYDLKVPHDASVIINGVKATPDKEEKMSDFSDATKYVKVPSWDYYSFNNLTKKPVIEITDDDGERIVFEDSTYINLDDGGKTFDSLKEAGIDFDIIKFAEDWSLFLTDDLKGGTHGFTTISKYFIPDSNMYKKARSWATSVDITFTSKHLLNTPTFPKEEVSDIVVYSDNAFKATVNLDKSMTILDANRTQKIDTFNSTVYVVKTNDGYKVTNIKGVID